MSKKSLKPGWKMVKFGEVVKNANLVERDPEANGVERIVGLEHIDPENLHIRRWNSVADGTSFTRKFVPGQTLFGKRRAYQRKVAYAEFEGICSGDILTFEPKNRKVLLPELLPFICQSDAFFDHALDTSAGSLSPRTSWTALKDFEFPLPPLDEQKRIAEILWAADEAVETYENLRADLSKAWFVELHQFWKSIEKSSGLNMTVEDVAAPVRNAIADGPFGSNLKSVHYREAGVPVIQSGFVTSGKFSADKYVYIDDSHFRTQIRSRVVPGDIVMAKIGENCGTCAILPDGHPESIVAGNALKITVNNDLCRAKYLLSIFHFIYHKNRMRLLKNETAQPAISLTALKKMKIPIPDVAKQDSLLSKLSALESNGESVVVHLSKLRLLLKSLLNGYADPKGAAHV